VYISASVLATNRSRSVVASKLECGARGSTWREGKASCSLGLPEVNMNAHDVRMYLARGEGVILVAMNVNMCSRGDKLPASSGERARVDKHARLINEPLS
jgi:hypothetical protein